MCWESAQSVVTQAIILDCCQVGNNDRRRQNLNGQPDSTVDIGKAQIHIPYKRGIARQKL